MKHSKRFRSKVKAQKRNFDKKYESYRSRARYKNRNPPSGYQFKLKF